MILGTKKTRFQVATLPEAVQTAQGSTPVRYPTRHVRVIANYGFPRSLAFRQPW